MAELLVQNGYTYYWRAAQVRRGLVEQTLAWRATSISKPTSTFLLEKHPAHPNPPPAQLYGLKSTFESPTFAGTVLAFTDAVFEASAAELQLCPDLLLGTPRAMTAVMQYSVLPPPARPFSGFVPGDQLATSYGVQTVSVARDSSAFVTLGSYGSVVRMQSVNMQAGGALVHTTGGVLMPYLY